MTLYPPQRRHCRFRKREFPTILVRCPVIEGKEHAIGMRFLEGMGVETRALNHETAPGLTSLIELDGGSRVLHALLAEKIAGRELAKSPD